MAYNKEFENKFYHSALAPGFSHREAVDRAHRFMDVPVSPRDPYASMADQFSDALPHAKGSNSGCTRSQPPHGGYYQRPRHSEFRTDSKDRYETREGYIVYEVQNLAYVYSTDLFSAAHEHCDANQPSRFDPCEAYPCKSSRADNRTSDRGSTPHSRPKHSTSISHGTDSGRGYNIREAVPAGSHRTPRPRYPSSQACDADCYCKSTSSSSHDSPRESGMHGNFRKDHTKPDREAKSDNRRTYHYPNGDGTYNTRTAVPNGMPHPSPPLGGSFQAHPPRTSQYGYRTRTAVPDATFHPSPPRPSQYGYGTHTKAPENPPHTPSTRTSQEGTLYDILGVTRYANTKDLKKAHRKLSLQHHPDRAPQGKKQEATEKMAIINQAFDVLKTDAKREKYDKTGEF